MRLLPRLRLLLARRPWLYWSAVGVCAVVVWLSTSAATARLERERDEWGATRRVWVTNGPIAPGEPIVASSRDYPLALLPSAAIEAPPTGVAAHRLAAHEVVVASDIADGRGLLPPGWLAFAVAVDGSPTLAPGDSVAVFGSGQLWCSGEVVAISEQTVEVGVAPECAAAFSAQLALGAVTLART